MNLTIEVYSEELDDMVTCEVVAEIHSNPEGVLGGGDFLDLDIMATYDKNRAPVDLSVLNEEDVNRAVCDEIYSLKDE